VSYLLDVNALVALIWASHVDHDRAMRWREGKTLTLCPLTELGFLRVSTSPAFNARMTDARQALRAFIEEESPGFIAADVRALTGVEPPHSRSTTDYYLANLAAKHGLKLATFDRGIEHPAAEGIA